jgi:membrane dipeptidase
MDTIGEALMSQLLDASDGSRAEDLHATSVVIDGMNNAGITADYLEQLRAGGVTAAMVPVSISDPFGVAVEKILSLRELVDANADRVLIVEDVEDIHRAKAGGLVGLILALEDTRQLDKDARKIRLFRDLGVRRMQLVYTTLNDVGSGAGDRVDAGLSRFGQLVVDELQAQRMLIDMCHAGPATHAGALERIARPCVWSHTNVRGVYDHPNNLTDEQLDAVGRNDGVVGISGVPFYTWAQGATVEHVVDHIDYVVSRLGVRHAAVGLAIFENHPPSFYDQFANLPQDVYGVAPWTWPDGITTVSEWPSITAALVARGYSDADIRLLLGGNYLRVLESAWGT